MVGVLLDDLLQTPRVGVGRALFVEVNQDRSAGNRACIIPGCLFDIKAGLAIASPLERFLLSGLAREDLNFVGDHEDGIKPDAELPNKVGIFLRVAGELRKEVLRAGARDGAEVRDEVFLAHADAGVGDGERLLLFVQRKVDTRRVDTVPDQRLVLVIGEA